MNNLLTAVMTILGGIITVAIVSVIVSQKSKAPEALNAAGGFFSRVIAAAVSPSATADTNGNLGRSAFSSPALGLGAGSIGQLGALFGGMG